jgi:peptidyl-prolyl cis-trans isomerase C
MTPAPRPGAAAVPPQVGGVVLAAAAEALPAAELRQRAHQELLRQAAIAAALLSADDPPPEGGVLSEAASQAIEVLLARELALPAPDEATCRRWHAANPARFAPGEALRLRHVLFAVTPGVDLARLRARAESCLVELRARSRSEIDTPQPRGDRFAAAAERWSNCPSGAAGGELGWISAADCAPELARELFGPATNHAERGVLPRLLHSRFGLHVVEVLDRRAGPLPPFEQVHPAVRGALERQAFATALRRYLQRLAVAVSVVGVELDPADAH